MACITSPSLKPFQSTCLREARLDLIISTITDEAFQSTCLREARQAGDLDQVRREIFQSTCLREARQTTTHEDRQTCEISIHVPT